MRNTSGGSRYFGYFPPHGKTLADEEEYSVAGDLSTRIAAGKDYQRTFPAYESALADVRFVILRTPAVHLYDLATDVVQVIALRNDALGAVTPCWGTFSESGGADPIPTSP